MWEGILVITSHPSWSGPFHPAAAAVVALRRRRRSLRQRSKRLRLRLLIQLLRQHRERKQGVQPTTSAHIPST